MGQAEESRGGPANRARLCGVAGCGERHAAKGLCKRHYKQMRRAEGYVEPSHTAEARRKRRDKTRKHPPGHWGKWRGKCCCVEGCEEPAKIKGQCQSHYDKAAWASGKQRLTAEQLRRARLRYRYGMELEEYDAMVAAQGGKCAICQQAPTSRNTRSHWDGKLCVDHCHDSGKVRGLLCNDCNLAIGYGKTPEVLRAAAEYLQSHD